MSPPSMVAGSVGVVVVVFCHRRPGPLVARLYDSIVNTLEVNRAPAVYTVTGGYGGLEGRPDDRDTAPHRFYLSREASSVGQVAPGARLQSAG
jgi:hypothetical protein